MKTEFREEIIDHYKNPRNFGTLKDKTNSGKGINAACGDMVEFYIKTRNDKLQMTNDKQITNIKIQNPKDIIIEEVKWRGVGCAMMTASASLLSEYVIGKKKKEVEKYNEKTIEDLVGEVNPGRIKCVLLPLSALKQALL